MTNIDYKALSAACKRVLGNKYNPRVEGVKLMIFDLEGLELILTNETSFKKIVDFYASQISHYMGIHKQPVKKSCKRLYAVYHSYDMMRPDEVRGIITVPCERKDVQNGIRSYKIVETKPNKLTFDCYEVTHKDNQLVKIAERIIYELSDDENESIKRTSKEPIKEPSWFKHIKSRFDFQRNPMNKKIHDMLPEPHESSYHGNRLWLVSSGVIMILVDRIWVNINKQQLNDIFDGKISVNEELRNEVVMYMGVSHVSAASRGSGKTVAKKAVS